MVPRVRRLEKEEGLIVEVHQSAESEDRPSSRSRARMMKWLPLLAVVILGIGLRVYRIGAQPLWIDETGSYAVAQVPQSELWGPAGKSEYSPPLYYSLQRVWFAFGDSETAIRSLSALCGVLNILLVYGLARTVGGHWTGTLAAALLATSGINIRYSQEARTYSLLVTAATLALWGLAYLMKHPKAANMPLIRWRQRGNEVSKEGEPLQQVSRVKTNLAWLAYGAGTATALYCHNTAALLPFLTCAVAVIAWACSRDLRRGFVLNWVLVNVVVLLIWSWWLPTIFQQFTVSLQTFYLPFPSMRYIRKSLTAVYGPGYLPNAPKTFFALAMTSLAAFGAWHLRRKRQIMLLLLGIVLGVPLLTLIASFSRPIWVVRVLLWPTTAWLTLVAVGVTALPRRKLLIGVSAVLMIVNLTDIVYYHRKHHKPPWDKATSVLASRIQPGDAMVLLPIGAEWPLRYYGRKADWWDSGPRFSFVEDEQPQRLMVFCKSEQIGPDELRAIAGRYPRVWFVARHGVGVPEETWAGLEKIIQAEKRTIESERIGKLIKVVLVKKKVSY